ncbi:unnamed protein product [Rhodiola kirilowii]
MDVLYHGLMFCPTKQSTKRRWLHQSYANGFKFNSYWLMTLASVPNHRSKVIEAFAQAQQYGLTLARTMAYSDGPVAFSLQPNPGQYNENVFQGLDFVVAKAREYGIRLVMSLVDNYADPCGNTTNLYI